MKLDADDFVRFGDTSSPDSPTTPQPLNYNPYHHPGSRLRPSSGSNPSWTTRRRGLPVSGLNMALKKSQLYTSLWQSCDELRGGMDASQYKDYVLVLLFIKYISDKYAGKPYAPIAIPKGASFQDMAALKGKDDIGDRINKQIIAPLAQANKLSDLPDFNDPNKLGTGKEMVDRHTNLIAIFESKDLDFSKNRADGDDILGDAYEYLMRHFATESGKSKGQFYTPAEVSRVIASVLGIRTAKTSPDTTVYAYLLHIIRSLKSTGRAACILPHGVLFRGNAEAEIRRNLIRKGYLQGIIGLPANLFYGTGKPPVVEQRAIASALSDVDGLLGALDRLIAKKRDLKQAAMQQLLTGQTRLPGFTGEWKSFELGDIADPNRRWSFTGGPFGSNLKSSDYTEDGVRIIQLQNIGDGYFKDDYEVYTSAGKADELISCNIYPGEIILSKMGDPVARAVIIPARHNRFLMCADGIRLAVDPTSFDTYFIYTQINAPQFRDRAENAGTGSTRKRIGLTELKKLEISCPPLPEQTAIAQVLSDMDAELAALEQRRDKTRAIKQGMMQELLTGRTRLVAPTGVG